MFLSMTRTVYLLVAMSVLACGPPAQQAQVQQPDPSAQSAKGRTSESAHDDYDRRAWKHWIDADNDCQDTRQEVLIEESEVPVTFKTKQKCEVLTGRWTCPYTGDVFTDPGKLEVDHMVPLAAAHAAGGYAWDPDRKRLFANDLRQPEHLIAVSASAKRAKGKKGPEEWLPPNDDYLCQYLKDWKGIKDRWRLSVTTKEREALSFPLDCT